MKKAAVVSNWALPAFLVLLPLCAILSACFDYELRLANDLIFAVFTACLAVAAAAFSAMDREAAENKALAAVRSLALPLSLIDAWFYLYTGGGIWAFAGMLVCVWCCCYLAIKHGKPLALKIICLALSALLALYVGLCALFVLMFGGVAQNAVVQRIESPEGTFYAEVIDSDQGALGGDTYVDVYKNKGIDTFLFKISKRPQRVYNGDWLEYERMEIYWKSDDCIVINDVEYTID